MTIARPVYAIEKPAPITRLGELTGHLTALWGNDLRIHDVGGKFVVFTDGDRCDCQRCDTFLREVAQFDYLSFPGFMIVCKECGSKRCPKAVDHADDCELHKDAPMAASR